MANKNIDVTALGELLIDFTMNGMSEQGNPMFEANPGGAPCNVLAMLQKLGYRTAFIGKVGNDMFGRLLKERTEAAGINMSGLLMDEEIHTTLAFVQKLENGDRDFSFYRKPGADIMLREEDVLANRELIERSRLFHFGTLSMTDEEVEKATRTAVSIAEENNCIISFDPNYRAPLWSSVSKAREMIEFGFQKCDVMKISDNEITLMTGEEDLDKGVAMIAEKYEIPVIFATMGKAGSSAWVKGIKMVQEPAYLNPNTIETTGAGDTFGACALSFILQWGLDELSVKKCRDLLQFANAGASLITTRRGALSVMPARQEIMDYLDACMRGDF